MNAEQFQLQLNGLINQAGVDGVQPIILLALLHMAQRGIEDHLIRVAQNAPQVVGLVQLPSQLRKQTND
jgi:hypothetical protein